MSSREFLKHHFHFKIKNCSFGTQNLRRNFSEENLRSASRDVRTARTGFIMKWPALSPFWLPCTSLIPEKWELGLEWFHPDSAFVSCQVCSRFRLPLSQHLFGTSLEDEEAKKWLSKQKHITAWQASLKRSIHL